MAREAREETLRESVDLLRQPIYLAELLVTRLTIGRYPARLLAQARELHTAIDRIDQETGL